MRRKVGTRILTGLLLALPLLTGASCDPAAPGREVGVTLVNGRDVPVISLLLDMDTAQRADPAFVLTVEVDDERLMEPGGSREVPPDEISGGYTPGEDLVVFVYEVRGDEAEFTGSQVATHAELRGTERRIEIR